MLHTNILIDKLGLMRQGQGDDSIIAAARAILLRDTT